MKYYFPIHLDGDNRGCEAIAKGTSILLEESKDSLLGLCRDISLDQRLGLSEYVQLVPAAKLGTVARISNKLIRLLHLPFKEKKIDASLEFVCNMTSDDILVSTGGDMMCYDNNQVITTNNYAHSKGCKTILWGCSMGPENLTLEKEETLHNFSLVYARESLTYDFFKSLGLKNVCLFPDPAFVLKPEKCELPESFSDSDIIGVNLSNYVLGGFSLQTPFGVEVSQMIDYIISQTKLKILLIPHVLWGGQDDRIVADVVMEKYGSTNRVKLLNTEKLNYCQIRFVISKCKMFVGSRTHSVISAYSTCVPALALGYSIKSRGLVKDLGLSEKLLADCRNIKPGAVLDSFKYMYKNENEIRHHLETVMPDYIKSTYEKKKKIKELYL